MLWLKQFDEIRLWVGGCRNQWLGEFKHTLREQFFIREWKVVLQSTTYLLIIVIAEVKPFVVYIKFANTLCNSVWYLGFYCANSRSYWSIVVDKWAQNEVIFHASHESPMSYSQLTNTDFYQCFAHDRRLLSSYSFQFDRFRYSFYIFSALTSSLRTIDTSAPVSMMIAAGFSLIFPSIVEALPLVKLLIFTLLAALFSPTITSSKVLVPFASR